MIAEPNDPLAVHFAITWRQTRGIAMLATILPFYFLKPVDFSANKDGQQVYRNMPFQKREELGMFAVLAILIILPKSVDVMPSFRLEAFQNISGTGW